MRAKGYPVPNGYMGLIDLGGWRTWMLFATESDYYEYIRKDI